MNTLQRCFALSILLLLTACAGMGGGSEDKMSSAYLKQHLIPGKTTKADVQQLFGAPGYKTEESNDGGMWSYSEAEINGGLLSKAMDYLPSFGSVADSAVSTGKKQQPNRSLNIHFNQNETIRSFNVSGFTGAPR
ncbi:hypothetical protein WJ969_02370 [Achromobacter xylosoxidans]